MRVKKKKKDATYMKRLESPTRNSCLTLRQHSFMCCVACYMLNVWHGDQCRQRTQCVRVSVAHRKNSIWEVALVFRHLLFCMTSTTINSKQENVANDSLPSHHLHRYSQTQRLALELGCNNAIYLIY